MELPNKKYQVIYADPPWRYDFAETKNRKIENQYETMDLEDIMSLNIGSITEENAVLYLWGTAPKLIEALKVMSAWGFKYKTHAIWDKEIIGMGYWFRGQHELLLDGTKNNFSPPKQEFRVSSIIKIRRTKHSKKPHIIMELIDKWYPGLKKIELFAREHRTGWDSWGNELSETMQNHIVEG